MRFHPCIPVFSWGQLVALCVLWTVPGSWDLQAETTSEERDKEVAKGFESAQKAVKSFLEAKTWEEAANYVLDKETLAERMKAHYAKYPWVPVEAEGLRYAGGSEVKGTVTYYTHDFQLAAKSKPNMVPMTMVQDGERYLLDWEIFAQTYDATFEEFLKGEETGESLFRVVMHRGVVMEDHEALGLEGGVVRLRVAWRPGIFFPGEFFAAAQSEAGKKIEDRVPWQDGAAFRVKVKWSQSKDGSRSFIEVVDLFSLNFATPSLFD